MRWWVLLALGLATVASAERYHYDRPGRLTRVIFTDLSSIAYAYDPNGNLTAVEVTASGLLNDADLDGDVDGDDLQAILQLTLDGDYAPTADCNLDETVSVLDLVCFTGAGAPSGAAPSLVLSEIDAIRGAAGVPAPLVLGGAGGVAPAVQTDILYDPGVAAPGTATPGAAATDHLVAAAVVAPGRLRLVFYSPTNAPLGAGEIAIVPWDIDGAAPLGMSALPLDQATVAGPDATALLPLTLQDGEIHVFQSTTDIAITKTVPPVRVANGDAVTYTVTVTNNGPAAVTGATVTDLVPAELVAVTWTCAAAGGATCTASGSMDVMDSIDLPVGGSVTYGITGTVDSVQELFDNTASVAAPPEVLEANAANDSATATVDVCLLLADLLLDDPIYDPIIDVQEFHACRIVAGPQFSVGPGGQVLLHGEIAVSLEPDFLAAGGELEVKVDPPPP